MSFPCIVRGMDLVEELVELPKNAGLQPGRPGALQPSYMGPGNLVWHPFRLDERHPGVMAGIDIDIVDLFQDIYRINFAESTQDGTGGVEFAFIDVK